MQFTDDRRSLHIEFSTQECDIPADEKPRLVDGLDRVAAAIGDIPSELDMKVIYHPRTQLYHAEAALRLPGKTLFTGDYDAYLDSALQRCLRKVIRKAEAYRVCGEDGERQRATAVADMNRRIVAPEDHDALPVAEAARSGDYRTFRGALSRYDEWLIDRVGRWVQRYPALNERVGDDVLIADLVEEVYLNAFERYDERPAHEPLSAWLESLIDPSTLAFLRDPQQELDNISFARSFSRTPRE